MNPHEQAYFTVAPFIFGKVVEVTTKKPWGFHEFERTNVTCEEYLKDTIKADVTILHILVGEGVTKEIFKEILEKSIKLSSRVLILEHNADSSDWAQNNNFWGETDFSSLFEAQKAEIFLIPGETDHKRNLLAVLDIITEV